MGGKIIKAEAVESNVATFKANIRLDFPTKDEEIQFMNGLCTFFKSGNTYLNSLFTDDLCRWVAGRIRDDFSADLHEAYMSDHVEMQKLRLALETFAKNAEAEAAAVEQEYEASIKTFLGELQIKATQIEALNRRIESLEKQLTEANLHNVSRLVELSNSKKANEETVTRLKATLWDMAERIAILERRPKNLSDAISREKRDRVIATFNELNDELPND